MSQIKIAVEFTADLATAARAMAALSAALGPSTLGKLDSFDVQAPPETPPAVAETPPESPPAKPKRKRRTKAQIAEDRAREEAEKTPPKETVDFQQVRHAVGLLLQAKGKPAVEELLAEFGARADDGQYRTSKIREEDWPAAVRMAQERAAASDD